VSSLSFHTHDTRGSLVAISYQKGSEYTREKRNTSSFLKQSRIPSRAPQLVRPGAHFYFFLKRKKFVLVSSFLVCILFSSLPLSFFLSSSTLLQAQRRDARAVGKKLCVYTQHTHTRDVSPHLVRLRNLKGPLLFYHPNPDDRPRIGWLFLGNATLDHAPNFLCVCAPVTRPKLYFATERPLWYISDCIQYNNDMKNRQTN